MPGLVPHSTNLAVRLEPCPPVPRAGGLPQPHSCLSSVQALGTQLPYSSLCPPLGRCVGGQVSGPSGWEWLASGPALEGYLWPNGEPGGAQQVMGKPCGPKWPAEAASPAACPPALPCFVLPSFSRVCVSFLLHAMAVVPRADETILGAAPGSPFPGNFLGTQMTPSTHFPGARASLSPC